jgi:hypothetical protein
MKVFLSVGATYSEVQERFVAAFESFLGDTGCEKLTVGRGNYGARQPILQARELMEEADAVVVLAFTRLVVKKAIEKPDSNAEKEIKNTRYPTIWNQLEASMAYGLKLPLLVILEDGLHQEAMLKDRLEFRALITDLDPGFFKTEEFKGLFANFKRIALERRSTNHGHPSRIASLTVGDLLQGLRPDQLWKTAAALVGLLSATAAAAYWLGKTLSS